MRIRRTLNTVFDGMIDELGADESLRSGPSGAPGHVPRPNFILDRPSPIGGDEVDAGAPRSTADARSYLEHQPAEAPSTDRNAIAAELGLRPGLSAEEIALRRRSFAIRNHPDRVSPALREFAHARMTIANALLDAEMAKLPKC